MLIQAGSSPAGKEFAAQHADVIFTGQPTLEDSRDFYQDIKGRAAKIGRNPDEVLILPGCAPIVGRNAEEAEQKYQEIANLVVIDDALNYLGRFFQDLDFTQYGLDEPFPELGDYGRSGWESATDKLKKMASDDKLTLRQMAIRTTTPKTVFVGTATQVADTMQAWFEAGAADGFMVNCAVLPVGLSDFIDQVLPILKGRDLFRTEYEYDTLHENLGLPIPQNQYQSVAKSQPARN